MNHVLQQIDGDLTLTSADAGKTFTDLDVTGTIDVRAASDVKFVDVRATRVVSTVDGNDPGRNVRFSFCEIHGESLEATPLNEDLVTDGTYENCNIHAGFRGAHVFDMLNVYDSWIHDLRPMPDNTHRESVLSNGLTQDGHINVLGSWLEAGSWDDLSGEIATFGDFGTIHDVRVMGCVLIDSGSYQMYAGAVTAKPYTATSNIIVVANAFGPAPASDPPGAQYGHVSGFDPTGPGNVWDGNTDLNGLPVPAS